MKTLLRGIVSSAVRNEGLYRLMDATVLKFSRYAEWSHRVQSQDMAAAEAIRRISPDLKVLHGPFAGMRYPRTFSTGSCLFPKLIGSYERELHPVLERICEGSYTDVCDVGCAEGYYAVGLAMRLPSASVRAYDTSVQAVRACEEMAEANGVGDRVVTGAFCGPDTLMALPFEGRALVIADCEGYEKELFTDEVVSRLSTHDVLIEIHDQIDIEISAVLRRRFEATHDIEVIRSIDDVEKTHTYDYEELAGYGLAERRVLLGEERSISMEWFFCTPRAEAAR